jgi:hemoglobin-like flavoprotein
MTPNERVLVQQSFALVAPIAATAAAQFYERLFVLDPSLRPLFRGDLTTQGHHLMQTLAIAVGGLDNLASLVPAVQALGRRHAAYGVQDDHYTTVGEALLWTLEQGLGDRFTPAVRAAWTAAYQMLATTMREAAASASLEPAASVAA